jgi:hypothetical protein
VEIEKVNGGVASTIFKGHEYGKEFLKPSQEAVP